MYEYIHVFGYTYTLMYVCVCLYVYICAINYMCATLKKLKTTNLRSKGQMTPKRFVTMIFGGISLRAKFCECLKLELNFLWN